MCERGAIHDDDRRVGEPHLLAQAARRVLLNLRLPASLATDRRLVLVEEFSDEDQRTKPQPACGDARSTGATC